HRLFFGYVCGNLGGHVVRPHDEKGGPGRWAHNPSGIDYAVAGGGALHVCDVFRRGYLLWMADFLDRLGKWQVAPRIPDHCRRAIRYVPHGFRLDSRRRAADYAGAARSTDHPQLTHARFSKWKIPSGERSSNFRV